MVSGTPRFPKGLGNITATMFLFHDDSSLLVDQV